MINRSIRGKMPRDATDAQWAAYHAAFKREDTTARGLAVAVYQGYSFCPVYDGRRKQGNWQRSDYIALDFDKAGLSDLKALPWFDFFCSFAYSTPSSTPEAPRCRGVFILDEPIVDAPFYRDAYAAVAWWCARDGLQTDPSCKDMLRLFYGSYHCELWNNWSILPRESLLEMVDQWRAENPPLPASATPPQFAGLPQTPDEQKIREALRYIPAWGDYGDWLRVLMAVHSVMPGSDGVALVEAWSPGKPGEVEGKFRSFTQDRPGGVSLGTLFKLAADYGYQPAVRTPAPAKRGNGVTDLRSML